MVQSRILLSFLLSFSASQDALEPPIHKCNIYPYIMHLVTEAPHSTPTCANMHNIRQLCMHGLFYLVHSVDSIHSSKRCCQRQGQADLIHISVQKTHCEQHQSACLLP